MANSLTVDGAAAGSTYGCALLATQKAQVLVEMLPGCWQRTGVRSAACRVWYRLTQSTTTHTTQHTPISNTLPLARLELPLRRAQSHTPLNTLQQATRCLWLVLAAFGPQACLLWDRQLHQRASTTTNRTHVNRQVNHTSSSAEESTGVALPMHACIVYQHTLSCCRCAQTRLSQPINKPASQPTDAKAGSTTHCTHVAAVSHTMRASHVQFLCLRLCL